LSERPGSERPRSESPGLRLRFFLFFALIGIGGALAVIGAMVLLARQGEALRLDHFVLFGGAAAAVVLGLATWVWLKFDERVARPLLAVANHLRAAAHARAERAMPAGTARHLGPLGPAVGELTAAMAEARREVDRTIAEATARTEEQRQQLATILRDLQQGVVICNLEHQVLLYNQRALEILHVAGDIGLGRSFFGVVTAQPFRHALVRLANRFSSGRHTDHPDGLACLVIGATKLGNYTLKGRVSLTVGRDPAGPEGERAERPVGYVVIFEDVTDELAAGIWRDRMLHDVTSDMRQRIANLGMIGDLLTLGEPIDADELAAAREAFLADGRILAERLDRLDEISSDLLSSAWPMTQVHSKTLLDLIVDRRSEGRNLAVETGGDLVWLHCDSASVVDLVDRLLNRTAVHAGITTFSLAVTRNERRAYLDLAWVGAPVPVRELEAWLEERLDEGLGAITGRDVLNRHKTDLWCEPAGDGGARLRLPLTTVAIDTNRSRGAVRLESRPEFYDFDLFGRSVPADLGEAPLRALTFVVFDTETTGLEPSGGDKIVQLAGVRIVNGRLLRGEVFNSLVHPGRPIPSVAAKVHGITDAMVATADPIGAVLPRFHRFVGDAVLVAHNAAFDMKFLTLEQDATGVVFTNPVLDTVLLGAAVFGAEESLTLDTLAERFDIRIASEERHTALGDALATGHTLLKLLDLLEAAGVRTLKQAFEASEQQAAIRRAQGKY
jgi:DNA polymerase-3 subunit epsilon